LGCGVQAAAQAGNGPPSQGNSGCAAQPSVTLRRCAARRVACHRFVTATRSGADQIRAIHPSSVFEPASPRALVQQDCLAGTCVVS